MKYLCLAYYDEKKFDALSASELEASASRLRSPTTSATDRAGTGQWHSDVYVPMPSASVLASATSQPASSAASAGAASESTTQVAAIGRMLDPYRLAMALRNSSSEVATPSFWKRRTSMIRGNSCARSMRRHR